MANGPTATRSEVTTQADAEFSVRLPSSATSGYLWQPEAIPDAVELLGGSVEQPAGPPRVGGPATHLFRFRAKQKGKFVIRFVLKRPWEREPIETHSVTLTAD